jgi:hypothetical protein
MQPDENGEFYIRAYSGGSAAYVSCNQFLASIGATRGAKYDVSIEDGFIVLTPQQEGK